ncbi:MAG: DUF1192 domain-containing protein [Geminicoccaceae bacterium]
MDEEEVRIRPTTGIGRNLAPMSIDEMEEYVTRLQGEIARVQAELSKRKDVRGAAEALFKPRTERA